MKHLSEIVDAARLRGRKRLAVAYGQDSHTLAAVYDAYQEGLVEPIIYGDRLTIEQVCKEHDIDSSVLRIIDEKSDVKAALLAATAVAQGEADVLMKGMLPTDKYMRAILNKDLGLCPPKATLSHVSVFEWNGYHKLLLASDIAIILQPDIKQKQQQIEYLRKVAVALGVETPKIGCVAPSEQVLPASTSSIEGAMLAKMADRGQLGNVIVDGPLSLDVALFKEVAEHKKVKGSAIAGDVDALLFPNIESGNVFFKSVSHLAGGEIAAIVMGAKVPCVLTSRGDSAASKKYSIALACMMAK
ncbi:MAG: phosphate butyryltransferase [Alistipes sp.]|nr:phosphate butyryltransferase [Alistipes sp.]